MPAKISSEEHAHTVDRLVHRQDDAAERALEPIDRSLEKGQAIEDGLDPGDQRHQRGPERRGRGAVDQRDGIEDQEGQVAQQRGDQDEGQQDVLDAAQSGRRIGLVAFLAPRRRDVQHRAQRTKPAAPDAAEEQRDDEHQRRADQQRRHDLPRGDHARDPGQRIEPEEQVGRQPGESPRADQQGREQHERGELDPGAESAQGMSATSGASS